MRWLLIVCALAGTASADGFYFTEGFGSTQVRDELSGYMGDGARIRISVGVRHEGLALEGFMAGVLPGAYDANPTDIVMYGLDLKSIHPISRHIELYVRGTVSGASGEGDLRGWAGRGLGVGAGVQLKGRGSVLGLLWWPLFFLVHKGPQMTAALWLDDGYEFYRLHGPAPVAIDAQLTHLTMGFAVGTDF